MRTALLLVLLLSGRVWASDEKVIEAADAAKHVGETLVVHGTVAEVHQFEGGSIVLNFGEKYPSEVFEVFIPKNLVDVTGDMHEYVGKEMVVEGRIELYRGKPEIKLEVALKPVIRISDDDKTNSSIVANGDTVEDEKEWFTGIFEALR